MIDIQKVVLQAYVRYWEDTTINGADDTEDGANIPCKQGDLWCPIINIETGVIENWEIGKTAFIHYKVVDRCAWELLDSTGKTINAAEGYVPDTLSPAERCYGDYIIMNIDENGQIANWKFELEDFQSGDEHE